MGSFSTKQLELNSLYALFQDFVFFIVNSMRVSKISCTTITSGLQQDNTLKQTHN